MGRYDVQGPPGERLSSSTSLTIKVLDENDNYPQFTQKTYYIQVSAQLLHAVNTVSWFWVRIDFDPDPAFQLNPSKLRQNR
jgi:hypothetical protein